MATYDVILTGFIEQGFDREVVVKNLSNMFNTTPDKVAGLLMERSKVIKTGLDEFMAQKYCQALLKAGAKAVSKSQMVITAEMSESKTPADFSSVHSKPFVAKDLYSAAFADVKAPNLILAELGVQLTPTKPPFKPPEFDFAHITLAPLGSDMGQIVSNEPVSVPSTDHIHLEK